MKLFLTITTTASLMFAAATAIAQTVPDAPAQATQIGDATRSLLTLQSSGAVAAPMHPMLGDEATASYARYLKSFDHPIPAQLGSSVGEIGSGAGGSASGGQN